MTLLRRAIFMFSFDYIQPLGGKGVIRIKISNISSLRRMQFFKLGKRIASTGSASTLGSDKRRASLDCCHGSYVLRQLLWKFKSQWKQAFRRQRSSAQYSYDLHSYSLNFDDGLFNGSRWLFFSLLNKW